jgi:hypothetical protein
MALEDAFAVMSASGAVGYTRLLPSRHLDHKGAKHEEREARRTRRVVTHPSRSSLSARGDYWPGASTIVPSNEPLLTPVALLTSRVTVKLPVAPANRPVPPVMA